MSDNFPLPSKKNIVCVSVRACVRACNAVFNLATCNASVSTGAKSGGGAVRLLLRPTSEHKPFSNCCCLLHNYVIRFRDTRFRMEIKNYGKSTTIFKSCHLLYTHVYCDSTVERWSVSLADVSVLKTYADAVTAWLYIMVHNSTYKGVKST